MQSAFNEKDTDDEDDEVSRGSLYDFSIWLFALMIFSIHIQYTAYLAILHDPALPSSAQHEDDHHQDLRHHFYPVAFHIESVIYSAVEEESKDGEKDRTRAMNNGSGTHPDTQKADERVVLFGEGDLGVTLKRTPSGQAHVLRIIPDTQAQRNGIQPGDIIRVRRSKYSSNGALSADSILLIRAGGEWHGPKAPARPRQQELG